MSAEEEARMSRKRVAEKELTKDNMNAGDEEEDTGPVVASAEELATRKIRKVRRPPGMEATVDKGAGSELDKAFGAAMASRGGAGGGAEKSTAAIAAGWTASKASANPASTSGFGTAGFSSKAAAPTFGTTDAPGAAPKTTFGFGAPAAAGTAAPTTTFGFGSTAAAEKKTEEKKEAKSESGSPTFGFKPPAEDKKVPEAAKSATSFGFSFGGSAAAPKAPTTSSPLTAGTKGPGLMEAVSKTATNSVFGAPATSNAPSAGGEKPAAPAGGFTFKIPEGCEAPNIKPKEEQKLPGEGEVTITTGEEDETSKFSANGKLRERVGDAWVERAKGDLKVNVKNADGSARVVMRDEVTRRAVLNSKIDDGFKVAKVEKNGIVFTAIEEDMKNHTYVLKVPDTASKKGEEAVKELQAAIEANRKKQE